MCEKKLEVGVILDSSTSVNSRNWNRTLAFLVAFSKEFVIRPTGVHFGVLHFAWRVYFDFAISDERYWTAESFEARVKTIKYRFGKYEEVSIGKTLVKICHEYSGIIYMLSFAFYGLFFQNVIFSESVQYRRYISTFSLATITWKVHLKLTLI